MTSTVSALVWRTVIEIEDLQPKEKSSCDKQVSQQSDHHLGSSSAPNHTFLPQAKENKTSRKCFHVALPVMRMIHFGFELPQRCGWQVPHLNRSPFSSSLYSGRNFTVLNGFVPVKKHTYSTAGQILQWQIFH